LFSHESLKMDYFVDSDSHTACPWKGRESCYHLKIGGEQIKDVAWYYPQSSDVAQHIRGFVTVYTNKVSVT